MIQKRNEILFLTLIPFHQKQGTSTPLSLHSFVLDSPITDIQLDNTIQSIIIVSLSQKNTSNN